MKKVFLVLIGGTIGLLLADSIWTMYKALSMYNQERKRTKEKEEELLKAIDLVQQKEALRHEKKMEEFKKKQEELKKINDEDLKKMKENLEKFNRKAELLYTKEDIENCKDSKRQLQMLEDNQKLLNSMMKDMQNAGIMKKKTPWKGDLREFMSNPNNQLIFD